ncbi:MAG TPA: hypothetical protein PKH64_03010 [Petrotogaceae bacterium]|nr:hypothetical protein [Petrotogaceae bacterium]HPA92994.1 hypothetical protein [Petrotogaceae bacterium]
MKFIRFQKPQVMTKITTAKVSELSFKMFRLSRIVLVLWAIIMGTSP